MKLFLFTLFIVTSFFVIPLNSYQCGVRKRNINPVIVRGQTTLPGEWPWHVAVYRRSEFSDSYVCGGTLISEYHVLSADHCVKSDNGFMLTARRIFVRLGMHNLQQPDPQAFQQHDIERIHEYGDSSKLKNDIVLLELSTKAIFTDFVQPACVNQVVDLTNQFGTAVGWGVTESDELSPVLKVSQMPVVSTLTCLQSNDRAFSQLLDSSIFCAGYLNGTTVCNGDSGGGLHFKQNGDWFVGGIISFTTPRDSSNLCYTKSYAGFTNINRFIPWIKVITGLQYLKTKLPQDCGRYLVNRVSRGSSAKLYEFPWIVEVIGETTNQELTSLAFGSLINTRYVLTAANINQSKYVRMVARLGEYNRYDKECKNDYEADCGPPVQNINIESVIEHPEFNKNNRQNLIALFRLAEDAVFKEHIQPVCLPIARKAVEKYIAIGWGPSTTDGEAFDILQKAIVPATSISECKVAYQYFTDHFYLGDGVFCAGKAGSPNTCNGDYDTPLGYPIQYPDKRVRFVQYGITIATWCDRGPSIYTDVAYYMDWILDNIKP